MITPDSLRHPPPELRDLVPLFARLSETSAEIGRVLAAITAEPVEADPCPPGTPIEHADRRTIEQWGRANGVPASLDAINDLRLRHGLAAFRMTCE